MKNRFYGFSWTTFFCRFFPALFRGDFVTFIGAFIVTVVIGLFSSACLIGLFTAGFDQFRGALFK